MIPLRIRENNKVRCVFWDEKDGIFVLDLVAVKVEKQTGYIYRTQHCGNGAIFKRDSLHQILYIVLIPDVREVHTSCQNR
jgi:hypothetical protein